MVKITEKRPVHLNVTCELSGLPIVRSNKYGMFCANKKCECEKKAMDGFDGLSEFVKLAAEMIEDGGPLDFDALEKAFPKVKKKR